MSRRYRIGALAALLLAVSALAVGLTAPIARADTQICDQYGSIAVGNYEVMNNVWGSTATQCINVTSSGFSIIQQDGTGNMSGAPASYPAIFLGCHYSLCSPNSPLPMQISQIGSATSSTTETYPTSGTYDAAYDIWLNQTTDVSGVQDTEIMIWLNHTGTVQPVGSNSGATVGLAGHTWNVWTGNNGSNNVVSYVANPAGIGSLTFDVKAFVLDAITRGSGYGNTSWYLTSIQDGFEPWVGGVGLAVSNFSASVTGGNPGTPTVTPLSTRQSPTPSPTPPRTSTPVATRTPIVTGGPGTCSASFHVDNSWGSGFQGTVTVSNTGTAPTSSWRVTWSWPGSQSIVNYWNASVSQSGAAVTANNLSYNGSIGAGGNTAFGLQVNGSAVTPTLSCAANGGVTPTPSATPVITPSATPVRTSTPVITPSATPITTPTPLVTPTQGGARGCSAAFRIDNSWGSGYQATVTVTNTGTTATTGWTVTITWPNSPVIVNYWNGSLSTSGTTTTVRNMPYNGVLPPGGSTTFGMQLNGAVATPTLTCTAS
jgi:hypothetical protein